jgi:hypothetical protein
LPDPLAYMREETTGLNGFLQQVQLRYAQAITEK